MTTLDVQRMGLAYIFGLMARTAPPMLVEDEDPYLTAAALNYKQAPLALDIGGKLADKLADARKATARTWCARCDTTWSGGGPCFNCSPQPVPSVFA